MSKALSRHDKDLILQALWAAEQWEDSIADAHKGHDRKPMKGLAGVVRKAEALSRRYSKLEDRLKGEWGP